MEDIRNLGKEIYEYGMDFAKWSAEMIRHVGDVVKEHLQKIWEGIQATAPYRAWEEITGGRLRKPLDLSKPENFELVDRVVPLDIIRPTERGSVGYHGTRRQFTEFDPSAEHSTNAKSAALGSFFSSDIHTGQAFAGYDAKGRVIEADLSFKNPITLASDIVTKDGEIQRDFAGRPILRKDAYDKLHEMASKALGKPWKEITRPELRQWAENLSKLGYDGFVLKDTLMDTQGDAATHYIAFKPEQIPVSQRIRARQRGPESGAIGRTGGPRKEFVSVDSNGDRHTGEWDPDLRVVPKLLATAPKEEANLYRTKNILGTKSDPKTVKGEKYGVSTYISYLQAQKGSGVVNLCLRATKDCIKGCLGKGGNGRYDTVVKGRIDKTKYFAYDPVTYMRQLDKEIVTAKTKSGKDRERAGDPPERHFRCSLGRVRHHGAPPRCAVL